MNTNEDLYLEHHGVKGQKWGVRRTRAQLGYPTSSRKKTPKDAIKSLIKKKKVKDAAKKKIKEDKKQEDQTKKAKQTRRNPKEMTDQELNAAVNRLRLEAAYNQLNPRQVSAGEKFVNLIVKDIVVPAVTESAKNVAKDYISKQMKNALNNRDKD